MFQKAILIIMLIFSFAVIDVQAVKAGEPANANESSGTGTISLAVVAPELYYQLRRYPKFYGDPNTIHGKLFDRSFLLDSVGAARNFLIDHGIYFDISVTQFLQGDISGGKNDGHARLNGSADYWLTFDTGKAGLWSGGAVMLHAESSWEANKRRSARLLSRMSTSSTASMRSCPKA